VHIALHYTVGLLYNINVVALIALHYTVGLLHNINVVVLIEVHYTVELLHNLQRFSAYYITLYTRPTSS